MSADLISNGNDIIKINVSNSKNDTVAFEVKFSKSLTIQQFKSKLEIITGGNAGTMQLELFKNNKLVTSLNDDSALLGSYPIETGMRVHVKDNFMWAADEAVEKFELSEEDYKKKNDTVRNYLLSNQLGKYNEELQKKKEAEQQQREEEERRQIEKCVVGARCQVRVTGNPTRLGTIMYNGPLDGKKGTFIGIKYDEPLGKNNGSFNGRQYFECAANYGGFVPPLSVEVGDFPPESCDLDDEI